MPSITIAVSGLGEREFDCSYGGTLLLAEVTEWINEQREKVQDEPVEEIEGLFQITDSDGFGAIKIPDDADLEKVGDLGEKLADNEDAKHGMSSEAFLGWLSDTYHEPRYEDALSEWDTAEEAYQGDWSDMGEYAEDFTRSIESVPDFLESYINWDEMGEDLARDGYSVVDQGNGRIWVFRD
jgi:hypothetical protein